MLKIVKGERGGGRCTGMFILSLFLFSFFSFFFCGGEADDDGVSIALLMPNREEARYLEMAIGPRFRSVECVICFEGLMGFAGREVLGRAVVWVGGGD